MKGKKEGNPVNKTGHVSIEKPINLDKEAIKAKGIKFTKDGDSWINLQLICAFLVQCRGGATVHDIIEDLKKLSCKVRDNTVSDACRSLQTADVLVEGQNASGVRVLSMRKYNFNKTPETAEVSRLIQQLREDPIGELIIVRLTKEPAKAGKNSGPWPSRPIEVVIIAQLIKDSLGGHLWAGNQTEQDRYFACEKYHTLHRKDKDKGLVLLPEFRDHTETPNMLDRTDDGEIIMCHEAGVRNAFGQAFFISNPSSNGKREFKAHDAKMFFMFQDITTKPKKDQISIAKLPVVRKEEGPGGKGRGAGPTFYEALKAGTEVKLHFIHPSKDFITAQEMYAWLKTYLPFMPMSHARHSQGYGRMKMVSFKYRHLDGEEAKEGWQEI